MRYISKSTFVCAVSRLLCLSIISFWIPNSLKAQDDDFFNKQKLFTRTQIGLNFTGILSHIVVTPQTGPNDPRTAISPGFEGTVDLGFNLNKTYGIQIGFGGGYQTFNYIISNSFNNDGSITGFAGTGTDIGYLTAPIEFVARKQFANHLYFYGGAGFTLRLYDTFDGGGFASTGDSTSKYFVKMAEITNSGPRLMMIPRLDLGLLWQLPYNDIIKFCLSLDVGQFSAYTSNYTYLDYHGNNTGTGSYVADASFVGVTIGYVFTRIRHI